MKNMQREIMISIENENKGKKKYILVIVIGYLLRIILFLLLLFALYKNEWLWAFFTVIMIIITFIPIFLRVFLKIDLPFLFDVFIGLALIFHMGNSFLNIGEYVPLYNKFTHFFSAVVVAFIFLILLFVFNEYYRGIAIHTFKILFDVVVMTMAFGVFWEYMEWSTDFLFGWNSQPNLSDTMGDLFADTMGGLFIAFIAYFLIKRGILKSFSKTFRKHFDDLIDDD